MTTQLAQTTTWACIPDEVDSQLGPWWRALPSEKARPGQFLETGSHTTPAPGWPNWQFCDGFRAFPDSQADANGSRPDRVSAVRAVREKHNPADFDDISISRIKVMIFYTAPQATHLNRASISYAFMEPTSNSSSPSRSAMLATPNHRPYHHSSRGTHQALSQYHPSNTVSPQPQS